MADYSIWMIGESNVSLTGGVTLDGITQGDGSHLVNEFITIGATPFEEVFITDAGDGGSDTNFSDNDGNQLLDGAQTIDGVTYADGTRVEAEYQFVALDPNTGIEYTILAVNFQNSSPHFGTVEGLAFVGAVPPTGVALEIISAQEGPKNNGSTAIDESEIVPLCFGKGTLIATKTGKRPVEKLQPGDVVATASGGYVVLRRVFHTKLTAPELAKRPNLRPVRIMAGAMGLGLPARDLLVSRQHRMLVSSRIAQRMFGARDVLVAAIKLAELPGIFVDEQITPVDYFHLLFDRHEVILAEGTPSESLFTGPEALKSVSKEARAEILTLFPELHSDTGAAEPACPIPKGKLQKQLIARHAKNARPLLDEGGAGWV